MRFFKPQKYQPLAQRLFDELSLKIQDALPFARIEHVGSSSIDGALSKGDLDIYVEVEPKEFKRSIILLKSLGFHIKKNTHRSRSLCLFFSPEYEMDVGVQLVARGSKFEFFLKFRDILNHDKRLRNEYNKLKIESSNLPPEKYRKAKSKFIEKVLKMRKNTPRN